MGATKKIFDNLNRELMKNLIPDKSTPIFGNSFTNCNDPIFDKSFEEIRIETLLDVIEYQEWDLELEKIKYNLNLE